MTTLSTTTCKNSAATSCLHSSAETVYFASLSFLGLVSSFHFSFSFMPALSRQNYPFCYAKHPPSAKAHIDEHSIHRYFIKTNAQSQVFGTFSLAGFAQICLFIVYKYTTTAKMLQNVPPKMWQEQIYTKRLTNQFCYSRIKRLWNKVPNIKGEVRYETRYTSKLS